MRNYDVVVLGAGSAGEAVARELKSAGKSVALIEKLRVGGECAYLSCMPSKAMLRSAQVRADINRVVELGASPVEISLGNALDAFRWAASRRDRVANYRNDSATADEIVELGIDLIRGSAVITGGNQVTVGDQTLHFIDLVIATGSTSTIPKIEGISEIEFWSSDQALSTPTAPATIAIIGGGPVACELAQIFTRFGSLVTILEFSPQLAGKEPPEIAHRLAENLRSEGVTVLLEVEVKSAKLLGNSKSQLTLADGTSIEVDQVIVAAGRHPMVDGFGLENISIKVNKKGAIDTDLDGRVKENLHVWAAGDVTGIAPFTHTANYQARIITENIMGGSRSAHYDAIPRAIYTDPPVASVGVLTKEKSESHIAFATFEISTLPRSSADGNQGGFLILAADLKEGILIGASAIGPHADEWLSGATLAIHAKIPLLVLEDLVHPFPTYSEALEIPIRKLSELSKQFQSKDFNNLSQ